MFSGIALIPSKRGSPSRKKEVHIMDSRAISRVHIGFRTGTTLWLFLKSLRGIHVRWLARNIDRSLHSEPLLSGRATVDDRNAAYFIYQKRPKALGLMDSIVYIGPCRMSIIKLLPGPSMNSKRSSTVSCSLLPDVSCLKQTSKRCCSYFGLT